MICPVCGEQCWNYSSDVWVCRGRHMHDRSGNRVQVAAEYREVVRGVPVSVDEPVVDVEPVVVERRVPSVGLSVIVAAVAVAVVEVASRVL